MAAETLVELYRFDEEGGTYSACVTLVYPVKHLCYVKGLCAPFTVAHYKELQNYLRSKGVEKVIFMRHGREKTVLLEASV